MTSAVAACGCRQVVESAAGGDGEGKWRFGTVRGQAPARECEVASIVSTPAKCDHVMCEFWSHAMSSGADSVRAALAISDVKSGPRDSSTPTPTTVLDLSAIGGGTGTCRFTLTNPSVRPHPRPLAQYLARGHATECRSAEQGAFHAKLIHCSKCQPVSQQKCFGHLWQRESSRRVLAHPS